MRRILWFRRDLRVEDNPLLSLEGEVLPIFIFDPHILDGLDTQDRRVTFIYEQVVALQSVLQQMGLNLAIFYGTPEAIIPVLLQSFNADEVCASGDYDAYVIERDRRISQILPFRMLHDTYIFRPEELLKADGSPYLVFTPFYNHSKQCFTPEHLQAVPRAAQQLVAFEYDGLHHVQEDGTRTQQPLTLEAMGFEPTSHTLLPPQKLLTAFETALTRYQEDRDHLDNDATSHLSPHLRFGTLGIRTLLRWLAERKQQGINTEPFFRQLMFRDFYGHMLAHFPNLASENFRYTFNGIPDERRFSAFCEGRTGVPIVDAGVRELLATGLMHNRARMVCASFFTKDLLLPWQWGEAFFAQHLLDYDAASNILSWQWSAGTGIDPQPYFRIFNPYLQGKKFDPTGHYIRRWIPALQNVDAKQLHNEAWLLSQNLPDYPKPIVEHKPAAQAALEHFKAHP